MVRGTSVDSSDEDGHHVLVSCPLILDDITTYDELLAANNVTYDIADVDQQLDEDELLEVLPQYDGIIAGDDELTRRVIESCDRLKVISKWGIGTDNIDFEAADENDVVVYNTPGAFSDEVADLVIGYAIMLTRMPHLIDQAVRQGDWYCPRGTSLRDKTFGVVGVGNIGATVARRAAALGMDIVGHDVRELPEDLTEETGIEAVGRDEIFSVADVVSLNCALVDETRGMVGQEELDALGEDGYLINTARGELVDQDSLVDALKSEKIAGAALDVFEVEPLPADSPLTDLENVILGSHNAQNTTEAVEAVNKRAVQNTIEGLQQ